MNPVGLIFNVFLRCIVNIHVLYKYEIDLIATENVIEILHYISVDQKGGCNVYREGLGTRRVAVISIGRV